MQKIPIKNFINKKILNFFILFSAFSAFSADQGMKYFTPPTIVFDIDDTFCHSTLCLEKAIAFARHFNQSKVFSFPHSPDEMGHYVTAPHFLPLILWLLEEHNANIVFFSAGIEERNIPLVEFYMQHILSPEAYKRYTLTKRIQIFSRHHQIFDSIAEKNRKSLCSVGLDADYSILIDDQEMCDFENGEGTMIKLSYDNYEIPDAIFHILQNPPLQDSPENAISPFYTILTRHHAEYTAGLLFKAFDMMQKNQKLTLRDALFQMTSAYTNSLGFFDPAEHHFHYSLENNHWKIQDIERFVTSCIDTGQRVLSPYIKKHQDHFNLSALQDHHLVYTYQDKKRDPAVKKPAPPPYPPPK